jgi:hypothetical protein
LHWCRCHDYWGRCNDYRGCVYDAGGGDEVVVVSLDLELEVSVESANATDTLLTSIATPKDKAAV